MEPSAADRVVQAGTFLYDGQVECDIRIVHRPVRYGTGDHEDPPEVSDDAELDTFYVQFGSTTSRGIFTAGGGGFPTFAAAVAYAEAVPGVGTTIRWTASAEGANRAAIGS